MNNFDEQDAWNGDRIEIIDPDVSSNAFNHISFLFTVAFPRVKFVVFIIAISLLIAFLQPSSSFVKNQAISVPLHVPASSSFQQTNACAVTISITPRRTGTWQLSSTSSPSSSSLGTIVCNNGTVLPVTTCNNGMNLWCSICKFWNSIGGICTILP